MGVQVTPVELKDIQLPDGMRGAMARQAEVEREKQAEIVAPEGDVCAALTAPCLPVTGKELRWRR
ncbi:MAG: hypothetical protein QJR12_13635 [Mycobacterium sp.]|uniref:hypothetical protein n=1 Tax=Mycobacterium sp. TaxID=1785 RepID=UPI002624253F|nr:hypothetical protein [Mycobacterium sp.]MDI3315262.1 hypothetical protein [Mycobacterium sp.]